MKKAGKFVISIDIKKKKFEVKFHFPSNFSVAGALVFGMFAGTALLAVSFSCSDLFSDFVRWIISITINS